MVQNQYMRKSDNPITFHIKPFLEFCEIEKGLSPTTTRNYDNFLKVFSRWLQETNLASLKPHELTPEHIWDYRVSLSRKKDKHGNSAKKTTQNYYLIALRNLLSYFAEKDIISLPSDKIKLPKLTDKDKAIKFLKFDQVEKLMAMPDVAEPGGLRDRAILETLFSTGMRVSEVTALNLRNFNVEALKKGNFSDQEMTITGKGGSTRTIYFSDRALKWLAQYLKTRKDMSPPLFINYKKDDEDNDHRLTPRSVERMMRKYAAMAGLPIEATPHTLRHSFATDLLQQGADMRSVQELLGHKNIVTTQIYTHVTNPHLRDIHKKFHSGKK
jgi:site-specific recombinase XerD